MKYISGIVLISIGFLLIQFIFAVKIDNYSSEVHHSIPNPYNDLETQHAPYSCVRRNDSLPFCDINTEQCECPADFKEIVGCNRQGYINAVRDCHCLTYDHNASTAEMGRCMYNCTYFVGRGYLVSWTTISLDPDNWTSEMCGRYHRTGPLCGDCITGYYPQVYSLDVSCKPCSNSWSNWVKYLLVAYVPLTVFCFIILLFRINITASRLQGHVFFSQLVTIHLTISYMKLFRENYGLTSSPIAGVLFTIYGIWNLDFFRSFDLGICLQVDMLTSISLDLAIAIYPLVLMILTYLVIHLYYIRFRPVVCMWRPFRSFFQLFKANSSWEAKASVIDAFATVFVLGNVKFQCVSLYLLAPIKVYFFKASGNVSYHWNVYASSGIRYVSHEHLPSFALALCVVVFLVAMPFLLILLYPFRICQCCLNLLSYRWQIILRSFVDTFQGCYKNGTESGTWDCRWFAVFPYLSQVAFIIFTCLVPVETVLYIVVVVSLVLFSIAIVIVDPHKPHVSYLSTNLALNALFLACFSVSSLVYLFLGLECFYYMAILFGIFPAFHCYSRWILLALRKCWTIAVNWFKSC